MNASRTFGVEIEMAGKLGHPELASQLALALGAAGFAHHSVTYSGYMHNTDGSNRTRWTIKTDGSIRTEPNYPHRTEVVSPVLAGPEGLRALKVVCDHITTNRLGKINSSCGLHVHHGVASSEVVPVLRAWIAAQDVIYDAIPNSRRDNRHCRKVTLRIPEGASAESVCDHWRRRRHGRYRGLNLESFWLRGTVEIRCAGGSYESLKVANWVLFTQLLVDRAVAGARIGRGLDGLCEALEGVRPTVTVSRAKGPSGPNRRVLEGAISRGVTDTVEDLLSYLRFVRPELTEKTSYDQVVRFLRVRRDEAALAAAAEAPESGREHRPEVAWFRARHAHFTARRAA